MPTQPEAPKASLSPNLAETIDICSRRDSLLGHPMRSLSTGFGGHGVQYCRCRCWQFRSVAPNLSWNCAPARKHFHRLMLALRKLRLQQTGLMGTECSEIAFIKVRNSPDGCCSQSIIWGHQCVCQPWGPFQL